MFGPHAVLLGEVKNKSTKLSKLLRSDDCLALPNGVLSPHVVLSELVAKPKQTVLGLVVRDQLTIRIGLEFPYKPGLQTFLGQLQFLRCYVWNFDFVFHKPLCCRPPTITINFTIAALTRQGGEFAEVI